MTESDWCDSCLWNDIHHSRNTFIHFVQSLLQDTIYNDMWHNYQSTWPDDTAPVLVILYIKLHQCLENSNYQLQFSTINVSTNNSNGKSKMGNTCHESTCHVVVWPRIPWGASLHTASLDEILSVLITLGLKSCLDVDAQTATKNRLENICYGKNFTWGKISRGKHDQRTRRGNTWHGHTWRGNQFQRNTVWEHFDREWYVV